MKLSEPGRCETCGATVTHFVDPPRHLDDGSGGGWLCNRARHGHDPGDEDDATERIVVGAFKADAVAGLREAAAKLARERKLCCMASRWPGGLHSLECIMMRWRRRDEPADDLSDVMGQMGPGRSA